MLDDQKTEFFELMKATQEVYDKPPPTKDAMRIWWNSFGAVSLELVRKALDEFIKTSKFPPRPADILEILEKINPDGRPGPDEAWSMIPRDEQTTVVMTEEMAAAMRVAQPLLDEGDQIAARMAFKEAYNRQIDQAKRAQIPSKWFISMGWDMEGRLAPVAEALRLGRIDVGQACAALPKYVVATMLPEELRSDLIGVTIPENVAKIVSLTEGVNKT